MTFEERVQAQCHSLLSTLGDNLYRLLIDMAKRIDALQLPTDMWDDEYAMRERGFVPKVELETAHEYINDLETQLETANANYAAMHDALLECHETIAQMDKRNHEIETQLAECRRCLDLARLREVALNKSIAALQHEKYVRQVKAWADEYEREADAMRKCQQPED